jgi:tryptophan 2,3-dioxygenase
MKEDVISKKLNDFDVRSYINSARATGRINVNPEERLIAASLYDEIGRFKNSGSEVSTELGITLEFAERALFSERFLHDNSNRPRYAAYTNLKILTWSLEVNRRVSFDKVWNRCRRVIRLLVQDLIAFEVGSLAGCERWQQKDLNISAVRNRIDLLQVLYSQLANTSTFNAHHYVSEPPQDWFSFALEESKEAALLHLSALPQTDQHDEMLFLRTIQISECIFWGTLTAVDAAIEMMKGGAMESAAKCLGEANWFTELLLPLFQAFKTMPVEHFKNFREQTGNASAIQSRTYQLMQIICQGVDETKVEAMSKTPEVSDLLLFAHPLHANLRSIVSNLESAVTVDEREIKSQVEAIDKNLHTWRTVHYGIARIYLADLMKNAGAVGTGGTSGPSYLKAHYRHMILKQPTHYAPWAMIEIIPQMVARPLLGQLN